MYFCQLYFIKTLRWLSTDSRMKSKPFNIAEHFLVRLNSLPRASYSCTEWTAWCPLKMDDQHLPRYILRAISTTACSSHLSPLACLLLVLQDSSQLCITESISESIWDHLWVYLHPHQKGWALMKVMATEYKVSDARLVSCHVLCIWSA